MDNSKYWKEVSKLYLEDKMAITTTNPIKKATMDEANQIKKLGEAADKALARVENVQRERAMKVGDTMDKKNYNKLLKKYNDGESLSWNETTMLNELRKADMAGELEPSSDVSDVDTEKLVQKIVEEVNFLTTKLRGFGIQVAPLSGGDFSLEAILQKLNEMRTQAKAKVRPQETETTEEPTEDTETVDVKKEIRKSVYDAVPIVELQLEEDMPGIGHKGEKMRVYKDGYSVF